MVRAKAKIKRERQNEISELMNPKSQRKFEREADNVLIDMEERAAERYAWAKALKDEQSQDVKVAVNRLVSTMARMAGAPKFTYKGMTMNVDGGEERLRNLQFHNHTWIAMRLLIVSAEWGIRFGDFKAPKGNCLRCGKKVK
jgi:hypothetical protein